MGISITQAILFLAIAPAFICLSHAGCSGSCAISGVSSYDFLGDPSINPSMDTFDDFVRDKLNQTSLSTKSISTGAPSIDVPLNQTNNGNVSLNNTITYNSTDNQGSGVSGNTVVKLGGSGTQDVRQSTLASTIFNKNII